ncbi:MAG TPA: hypothetical protein VM487_09395 [Phycisphaerae bacterium]|nr:hypothetical protein [Phycisphaerae bacterium]
MANRTPGAHVSTRPSPYSGFACAGGTGGLRCLFCSRPDIEGGSVDIDSGGTSQRVTCSACRRYWFDVYELVGVLTDKEVQAALPEAGGDRDADPT